MAIKRPDRQSMTTDGGTVADKNDNDDDLWSVLTREASSATIDQLISYGYNNTATILSIDCDKDFQVMTDILLGQRSLIRRLVNDYQKTVSTTTTNDHRMVNVGDDSDRHQRPSTVMTADDNEENRRRLRQQQQQHELVVKQLTDELDVKDRQIKTLETKLSVLSDASEAGRLVIKTLKTQQNERQAAITAAVDKFDNSYQSLRSVLLESAVTTADNNSNTCVVSRRRHSSPIPTSSILSPQPLMARKSVPSSSSTTTSTVAAALIACVESTCEVNVDRLAATATQPLPQNIIDNNNNNNSETVVAMTTTMTTTTATTTDGNNNNNNNNNNRKENKRRKPLPLSSPPTHEKRTKNSDNRQSMTKKKKLKKNRTIKMVRKKTKNNKHMLIDGDIDDDLSTATTDTTTTTTTTNRIVSLSLPQTKREYQQLIDDIRANRSSLICPICAKQFPKNSNLVRHVKSHFKQFRPRFTCRTCGKQLLNRDNRHDVKCAEQVAKLTAQPGIGIINVVGCSGGDDDDNNNNNTHALPLAI
ncbi:putative uncharacterized protein DDB_G0292292 [Oppia nitens]|uniref:putative uncharacterized protein DDB_G0292292 n=1 Tax=Oppia nitens TaxID=1686743 RepID=UPI0023DA2DA4|nr:putative uncharacterized protein DDB_G0292292 [Oppia nitens]